MQKGSFPTPSLLLCSLLFFVSGLVAAEVSVLDEYQRFDKQRYEATQKWCRVKESGNSEQIEFARTKLLFVFDTLKELSPGVYDEMEAQLKALPFVVENPGSLQNELNWAQENIVRYHQIERGLRERLITDANSMRKEVEYAREGMLNNAKQAKLSIKETEENIRSLQQRMQEQEKNLDKQMADLARTIAESAPENRSTLEENYHRIQQKRAAGDLGDQPMADTQNQMLKTIESRKKQLTNIYKQVADGTFIHHPMAWGDAVLRKGLEDAKVRWGNTQRSIAQEQGNARDSMQQSRRTRQTVLQKLYGNNAGKAAPLLEKIAELEAQAETSSEQQVQSIDCGADTKVSFVIDAGVSQQVAAKGKGVGVKDDADPDLVYLKHMTPEQKTQYKEKKRFLNYMHQRLQEDLARCRGEIAGLKQVATQVETKISALKSRYGNKLSEGFIVSQQGSQQTTYADLGGYLTSLKEEIKEKKEIIASGGCGGDSDGDAPMDMKAQMTLIKKIEGELDTLVMKNLPKADDPGYGALEAQLFYRLRENGLDVEKLEVFRDTLIERIGTLEPNHPLPSYFQSLGFASLPSNIRADDVAGVDKWRESLSKGVRGWWLKLLALGDGDKIAKGLGKQARAIAKFDSALASSADGVVQMIKANQEYTEHVIGTVPLAGDALDIVNFMRGETLSGRDIGWGEILLNMGMRAGIPAIGKSSHLVKRIKNGERFKDILINKQREIAAKARHFLGGVEDLGRAGAKRIKKSVEGVIKKSNPLVKVADELTTVGKGGRVKVSGQSVKSLKSTEAMVASVKSGMKKVDDELTTAMRGSTDEAAEAFAKSKSGKAAAKALDEAKKEATDQAERMNDIFARGNADEIKREMVKLQQNKLAKQILKKQCEESGNHSACTEAAKFMNRLYSSTDDQVKKVLHDLPEVKNLKKRYGNSVEVKVKNITNKKLKKAGVVDRPNFGADRDVTYVVEFVDSDGIRRSVDINPSRISADYNRIFAAALDPEDAARVMAKVRKEVMDQAGSKLSKKELERRIKKGVAAEYDKFAHKMEQNVTWKSSADAYVTGNNVPLKMMLNKRNTPTIKEINTYARTFTHKSEEFFDTALRKSGNYIEDSVEGSRQFVKQVGNIIEPRMKRYGVELPPHLREGLRIMKKVKNMEISPQQANAMLNKLGTHVPGVGKLDMSGVVQGVGGFLEKMERTAGKQYRATQYGLMADVLRKLPKDGSISTFKRGVAKLNKTLWRGGVDLDDLPKYAKLRSAFIENMVATAKGSSGKAAEMLEYAKHAYRNENISRQELGLFLSALK